MKIIELDLPQLIAVMWVWHEEIYPVFFSLWQKYGKQCRSCSAPEKHIRDYDVFSDQLCAGVPEDKLIFTKSSLSMFASTATQLLENFLPEWKPAPGVRKTDAAILFLGTVTPEDIVFQEPLIQPAPAEYHNARKIIRKLLAVDHYGIPEFRFSSLSLGYSVDAKLRRVTIRQQDIWD